MGALVMAHSDDEGLILPPKLAPIQVVIIPVYKSEDQQKALNKYATKIKSMLELKQISVKYDNRDTHKPGFKFAEYELKGVPVRIAIGPRDLENQTVEVARRDTKEKSVYQFVNLDTKIENLLNNIQQNIFNKALDFRDNNTFYADSIEKLNSILDSTGGSSMLIGMVPPRQSRKLKKSQKQLSDAFL